MNNLFIVGGGSGAGKSTLINYVKNNYTDAYFIKKYTTRPKRQEEKNVLDESTLDLTFSSKIDYEKIKDNKDYFIQTYGGEKYWFDLNSTQNALDSNKNNFIFMSDFDEMKKLKQKYVFNYNCILVYVYADRHILEARLNLLPYKPEDIKKRLDRSLTIWKGYLKNNYYIVDHIIINTSTKEDFYELIDGLLYRYN